MKILKQLSIVLVISLTGCGILTPSDRVKGSGVVKTEKRSLGSFTTLDVSCAGTIQVHSQAPDSFEISGDDNIVPLITTEVKNDTLYIRSTKEYSPKDKLQITVAIRDLKRFAFAGAGEADLSNISNDRLELVLSGAGSFVASGETKDADISLSGAGSVDAKNLHAVNAKVNSTGVGSVDVYASGQLDAKAAGVGEINYYGNPKSVNKQAAGLGSINQK